MTINTKVLREVAGELQHDERYVYMTLVADAADELDRLYQLERNLPDIQANAHGMGQESAREELDRLRAEGACDACAGTGVALSGACMCRGTGRAANAVVTLREQLFAAEARIAELEREPTEKEIEAARSASSEDNAECTRIALHVFIAGRKAKP